MYRCWKWYLEMLLVPSAFARQSRIFDSIDALLAFYRMPKCLNWRSILSWSDLDPNSDNVFFFFFKGERIQISLKAGHHRPASETPLNGVSLACRWWPNVECWLGNFENFRGSGPVLLLLRNSIFLWFFRGGGGPDPLSPLWICAWDRTMYTLIEITENPFYRAHRLLYNTLPTFYRIHKFLNWRNILSWIPFGSDLDPNRFGKCK